MVAGIDEWLLRWADIRDCEPNEKCKECKNVTCEYWQDYNSEVKND